MRLIICVLVAVLAVLSCPSNATADMGPSVPDQTISFSTPGGTFVIPRPYLGVSQAASENGKLTITQGTLAFELQMPNGDPVGHDYGFEGLPEVAVDQASYPVVVNDVSFDAATLKTSAPERMLANILLAFRNPGVQGDYPYREQYPLGMMRFISQLREGDLIYYYASLSSVGQSGDARALLRCSVTYMQHGALSACDGWESVQGLGTVMHVRFPRLKIAEFDKISRQILSKLEIWKRSEDNSK